MKHVVQIALAVLCIYTFQSKAQDAKQILKDLPIHRIDHGAKDDFRDLQFLKEILKGNRILLLGEQSHGDGATFEAKVRLIKFLHQELNYDIISFESGLFDNHKAFAAITDEKIQDSPLKESIIRLWSDTREVQPLLEYIHHTKNSSHPLIVTGFDCQTHSFFTDQFLNDVRAALQKYISLDEAEVGILEEVIAAGPEFLASNDGDSVKFFSAYDKLMRGFEKLTKEENSIDNKILKQSLIGWVEMVKWQIDSENGVHVAVQNPRDLQMAKNLIFLSELYPDKKIIGWGASYHFADQIDLYKNTNVTRAFTSRMDSIVKSEDPTDLDKDLGGAIPMGKVVKEKLGASVYSMAFSSFEGEFGVLGNKPMSLQPLQPPPGSIEQALVTAGYRDAFVDYRKRNSDSNFYSSALGNLPIYAPWNKLFDGLYFIKTSFPPSFPIAQTTTNNPTTQPAKVVSNVWPTGIKKVIDERSGEGIAYATVFLLNSSQGVSTNLNGEFTLMLSKAKPSDKIVFSSIGYLTDTLSLQEFTNNTKIELRPAPVELASVEIRAKSLLNAKDIIKLARKKIEDNYYQGPNHQEFFYRVKSFKEDSVEFNEEASVLVYNPSGYTPSSNINRKLKGQILQFRNTTNNEDNRNAWAGVGSLWLIYTHDLILEKDNVLHRTAHYDVTLEGTTLFEGRKVYEISFDCKRPGAYTTGFGYPAPLYTRGKIFIAVDSHAVLKIETLIRRKGYNNKKRPHLTLDPYGHQLVQTYKEYNGKYFLNYSKQVHFGSWSNTKTNSSYRHIELRELLSTDIRQQSTDAITVSLTNIKSVPVKEDPEFWKHHNIKLDDNVEDSYKAVGLGKN